MIEYFRLAYRNIKNRALRSWLTILGIIIGVFLVVSLISLSEGLNKAIMSQLQAVGTDTIMILPGDGFGATTFAGGLELKDRHLQAIRRTAGVESVLEMPYSANPVRYQNTTETTFIMGLDMGDGLNMARDDMGFEVREGQFARPGRREVTIGHLVPRDTFPGIEPGDEITVAGRKFTVAGILKSLGNREDDNSIIFDLPDYRTITDTVEGTPVAIAKVADGYEVDTVVTNIEYSLEDVGKRRRGEESPSFSVMSSEAMIDMVESILGVLQAGIVAFASIAILVGAIGVMNTMFTSVRERTKEIGVLKAVGAKQKHISRLFLIESGMIGALGGVLGVGLGVGFAKVIEVIIRQAELGMTLEAHFSVQMILLTLFFSFLLGCISGYFPAQKAAKLNPVDALMYE